MKLIQWETITIHRISMPVFSSRAFQKHFTFLFNLNLYSAANFGAVPFPFNLLWPICESSYSKCPCFSTYFLLLFGRKFDEKMFLCWMTAKVMKKEKYGNHHLNFKFIFNSHFQFVINSINEFSLRDNYLMEPNHWNVNRQTRMQRIEMHF